MCEPNKDDIRAFLERKLATAQKFERLTRIPASAFGKFCYESDLSRATKYPFGGSQESPQQSTLFYPNA